MLLRGARDAIGHLRARFPDETLEVVYAGTGPLAPLVLPLLASDALANARVTFIDINEASIRSVQRLVLRFADGGDHAFVVCDATEYRHGRPIHLVITETMQRALSVEPQVAIATNLVGQLERGGVLMPECVRIDLCFDTPGLPEGQHIETVMELSAAAIHKGAVHSLRSVIMPRIHGNVFFSTSVRAFGEHSLMPGDSGLTMPAYLWDLGDVQEREAITFWYEIGERPGIRYRRNARAA